MVYYLEPKQSLSSELGKETEISISAKATGRHEFEALEIVLNGEVIATQKSEVTDFKYRISKSAWIAARIKPKADAVNELGRPVFAHTSPVYIRYQGKGVYLPEAAEKLRTKLINSRQAIMEKGIFASDKEREAVANLYKNALEQIE